MIRQLSLFDDYSVDDYFRHNIQSNDYELEELDIGDITFVGGQKESIHRWYRLTPSFSPALVRYFIESCAINQNSFVLDPFSGRGTTIIECKKHQIASIGFEINPLLQRVCNYSLIWSKNNLSLLKEFEKNLQENLDYFSDKSLDDTITVLNTDLPNIHNVFRWWQPNILKDLIIARQLALLPKFSLIYKYLWLVINNVSLDCANIHRHHPTITFDDGHNRSINVFQTIQSRLLEIEADLLSLNDSQFNNQLLGKIELRDSCLKLPSDHICLGKVTHILTSPPYPNRYSYVHQTRPQLYFMEVINKRHEATEIDLATIGGTWGKATSNLAKKLIIPSSEILEILDYFPLLREQNLLMCNYATKYFLDLNQHIQQLKQWVTQNFVGVYIIGNSRLSGVEIFTETILARLFELNGFKIKKIIVFRKRGGRQRLYETAVIVTN